MSSGSPTCHRVRSVDAVETHRNRGSGAARLHRAWVLQVRREQAEAPFEDPGRTSDAVLGEHRRRDSALRRPSRMQELGVRTVDPALEQASGEAATRAGRGRELRRIEPNQLAGAERDPEGRKQPGRVKSAPMKLSCGHAADATGHLVGDRDGQNQITSGNRPRLGECERRGDGRTAHVNDRLVVRIVEFERLRQRRIRERRGRRRRRDRRCR